MAGRVESHNVGRRAVHLLNDGITSVTGDMCVVFGPLCDVLRTWRNKSILKYRYNHHYLCTHGGSSHETNGLSINNKNVRVSGPDMNQLAVSFTFHYCYPLLSFSISLSLSILTFHWHLLSCRNHRSKYHTTCHLISAVAYFRTYHGIECVVDTVSPKQFVMPSK